jgi:imidazolonepropionase-like amidohydrolase
VIDCAGRTLMPGLIDCHVHVMLSEVNIRYLEAIRLTMMTVRAASLMRANQSWRDKQVSRWRSQDILRQI